LGRLLDQSHFFLLSHDLLFENCISFAQVVYIGAELAFYCPVVVLLLAGALGSAESRFAGRVLFLVTFFGGRLFPAPEFLQLGGQFNLTDFQFEFI